MHEIKGKKHADQSGADSASGNPFAEQVHCRNHGDTKEDAHDPPAEGIHSKERYACADNDFAQGRMCIFIGGLAVQKFPGSPCMVNFVEIHTVSEGASFRDKGLLVKQGGTGAGIIGADQISVSVCKGKLQEGGLTVQQGQTKDGYLGLDPDVLPGKYVFQL